MTARTWKILVVGAAAVGIVGGFAAAQDRSSASTKPSPSWGIYSSEGWNELTAGFAKRGFARSSVHVVTGTTLANGQAFALVSARSTKGGRTCFAVARARAIGATLCRLAKPVSVFYATDSPRAYSVLALVRADVTVKVLSQGRESGVGVVPAGPGFAFNELLRRDDRVLARDAGGRLLAEFAPPA